MALRKGKRSCTDHPILNFISYDHLNSQFHQFALLLSSELYLSHVRRLYWCLPGSRPWMRKWCSCFSKNLRVGVCIHRWYYCEMSLSIYFEVSPRWISGSL